MIQYFLYVGQNTKIDLFLNFLRILFQSLGPVCRSVVLNRRSAKQSRFFRQVTENG